MKAQEIIAKLEQKFPLHLAAQWDNPGLLAGSREKEVKRVYVALDATDEVVDEAVKQGADMLLTHHPLIFHAIHKVNEDDLTGRRLVKLIRNDITYYAMHTNYDVVSMGRLAADMIGLTETQVLYETQEKQESDEADTHKIKEGYGRTGLLSEEMTLTACAELVKEKFCLPDVRVFGDLNQLVRKAAISPGSGKGMSSAALEAGAEVLITGDIDHHEGIDALADGLAVIDAGHYGLEHIFIQDMKEYVRGTWETLDVCGAGICQPYQTV